MRHSTTTAPSVKSTKPSTLDQLLNRFKRNLMQEVLSLYGPESVGISTPSKETTCPESEEIFQKCIQKAFPGSSSVNYIYNGEG